jgi:mannose-6-phosphate isomerase-like protein (cupin superfamily)
MQIDLLPPVTAPVALRPGEGPAVWVAGVRHVTKVSADQTGGAFAVVEAVVPPWAGPPPHVHAHEAEAFIVLDGTFELLVEDRTVVLEAGGFAYVPAGTVHTFLNVGEADGRLLAVISPGGFEGYFDAVGTPVVEGEGAPAFDEAAVGRMLAHAPAYGLTFPLPSAG